MSHPSSGSPLTPEARHLARELSTLREATGLSLAALSDRTTASKSSWHRYLNGTKLPPVGLVRELCALAKEPPERLLALWELAQAAASRQGSAADDPPTEWSSQPTAPPTEAQRTGCRRLLGPRPAVFGMALLTAAAVATASWTLTRDSDGDAPTAVTGETAPGTASTDDRGPRCEGEECRGLDADREACTLPGMGLSTVAEHRLPDGTGMEVRYSEACGAGWGRIWGSEIGDELETTASGNHIQSAQVRDSFDAEGYVYTTMVDAAPEELEVCLLRASEPEPQCIGSDS